MRVTEIVKARVTSPIKSSIRKKPNEIIVVLGSYRTESDVTSIDVHQKQILWRLVDNLTRTIGQMPKLTKLPNVLKVKFF